MKPKILRVGLALFSLLVSLGRADILLDSGDDSQYLTAVTSAPQSTPTGSPNGMANENLGNYNFALTESDTSPLGDMANATGTQSTTYSLTSESLSFSDRGAASESATSLSTYNSTAECYFEINAVFTLDETSSFTAMANSTDGTGELLLDDVTAGRIVFDLKPSASSTDSISASGTLVAGDKYEIAAQDGNEAFETGGTPLTQQIQQFSTTYFASFEVSAIPEPSTCLMTLAGLGLLAWFRRPARSSR